MQGIRIKCLQDKLIYPLYGVWSPTSQEYLDLFSNYVSQIQSTLKSYDTLADLGCGTGVLPIITSLNGGFSGKIYSFDKESNCIEASKMNSQIFGLSDKNNPIEIDLIDLYKPSTVNQGTQG
jgi:ribosomal protein L11 methylase PrmA